MNGPVHGEIAVAERSQRVQLFTADGAVNLVLVGLDAIPRTGETVELGPGRLYVVEHVRWLVQPTGGLVSLGAVTARVLLRPGADPVAPR